MSFLQRCDCGWNLHAMHACVLRCGNCGRKHVMDGKPAPRPRWVKIITRLRQDGERGVGDTVRRLADKLGGERFKALTKRLGVPCGCIRRQESWNYLYPYPKPPSNG